MHTDNPTNDRRLRGAHNEEGERARTGVGPHGPAPLCYAASAEPMYRPDHKAKKHGRPKPKAHYRRVVRRKLEAAVAEALGVVL